MKYIRTKDSILLKDINNDKYCEWLTNEPIIYDIIAQANTIRELCDEFVVAYEDGARIVYCYLEQAKTKAKASLEFDNKSVIYGAIWTDKGLIYVARINDKGDLELL